MSLIRVTYGNMDRVLLGVQATSITVPLLPTVATTVSKSVRIVRPGQRLPPGCGIEGPVLCGVGAWEMGVVITLAKSSRVQRPSPRKCHLKTLCTILFFNVSQT